MIEDIRMQYFEILKLIFCSDTPKKNIFRQARAKRYFIKIAGENEVAAKIASGVYSWETIPHIKYHLENHIASSQLGSDKADWIRNFVLVAALVRLEELGVKKAPNLEMVVGQVAQEQGVTLQSRVTNFKDVPTELQEKVREKLKSLKASDITSSVVTLGQSEQSVGQVFFGANPKQLHTLVSLMAANPDSFSYIPKTMGSLYGKEKEILSLNQRKQIEQASGNAAKEKNSKYNNVILNYINNNKDMSNGLVIEPIGTYPGMTSEDRESLVERMKREQEEGGGVCVHTVHKDRILSGTSLFASVRDKDGQHLATIKFEDGFVYEIKGHNNGLVGNQIKGGNQKLYSESIRSYISTMISEGIVEGIHSDKGQTDFANLLSKDEVARAVDEDLDDYSPYLASALLSTEDIQKIYSKLKGQSTRIRELTLMASNKNTDASIQSELLKIDNNNINIGLASNESVDKTVFDQLVAHSSDSVRMKAFANVKFGYKVEPSRDDSLKMLRSKDSKIVSRAVAASAVTEEDISHVIKDPSTDTNTKANILLNKNVSLETKQIVFDSINLEARISMVSQQEYGAKNPDIAKLRLSAEPNEIEGLSQSSRVALLTRSNDQRTLVRYYDLADHQGKKAILSNNIIAPPDMIGQLLFDKLPLNEKVEVNGASDGRYVFRRINAEDVQLLPAEHYRAVARAVSDTGLASHLYFSGDLNVRLTIMRNSLLDDSFLQDLFDKTDLKERVDLIIDHDVNKEIKNITESDIDSADDRTKKAFALSIKDQRLLAYMYKTKGNSAFTKAIILSRLEQGGQELFDSETLKDRCKIWRRTGKYSSLRFEASVHDEIETLSNEDLETYMKMTAMTDDVLMAFVSKNNDTINSHIVKRDDLSEAILEKLLDSNSVSVIEGLTVYHSISARAEEKLSLLQAKQKEKSALATFDGEHRREISKFNEKNLPRGFRYNLALRVR